MGKITRMSGNTFLDTQTSIEEKNNVFFYYRYWDINKSEVATGTYADILVFEAYEPENTTIEYGIGYSWMF